MLLRVVQRYQCVLQLRDQTTHHLVHNTGQSKLLHVRSLLGQSNVLRSIRTSIRHRNALHANLQPVESPYGGGSIPSSNVMKALIFTGTFSLASFFGATVLEYENTRNMMLDKARQAKLSWMIRKTNESNFWLKLKGDVKRAWEQLTPGDRIFIPICALNVLVFLAWRLPILKEPMLKYFCSNPASRAVCWPMLFSTFSHYSALHLCANMYVLHSFSSVIVASLGKEQFLGLYLSAGVVSSLTSILYKSLTGQAGLSLGASGAIMAVLAYVCAQYPDTKLTILFLPMLSFSAGSAIKVMMGVDFAGCVLGWKFFDHAAHLGGALFGLFWAFYGLEVWHKRIPFLTKYHDWRKTK